MSLLGTGGNSDVFVSTPGVANNAWHYVVATYSGTSTAAGIQIYIDGVQQTLTTSVNDLKTSILNNSVPAMNGRSGPVLETKDWMDEIRISAQGVVFPASYVTTSYNNQSHPATFFTVQTGLTNP
jgi:hypothetical protein